MRIFVHRPIAMLDSGVGGLTVAKEVMRQLPQERIIYFGDTARAPYGPRSAEEVLRFTRQIVQYLLRFHPKMIVIACNTATAMALDTIKAEVDVPVVGVIHPGARAAIKATKTGIVGVIGTEGTIQSGAYETALKQLFPDIQVASLACPQFVPLVEQGLFHDKIAHKIVSQTLSPLKKVPIDCLILGCTHYPFLAKVISEVMGPDVTLISSAEETAVEISAILAHHQQLANVRKKPAHRFFCSGDPFMFQTIAQKWLDEKISVRSTEWKVSNIG